jgi:hypothetical protein
LCLYSDKNKQRNHKEKTNKQKQRKNKQKQRKNKQKQRKNKQTKTKKKTKKKQTTPFFMAIYYARASLRKYYNLLRSFFAP